MTAPTGADEAQTERLARLLDSQFRVPGTSLRFGVEPLLGLVPGLGDAAGLALSSAVIVQAVRLGARGATVARMVLNVAIDAVFGSIPLLGSVFDFAFKANNRNVALLQRHERDPAATSAESRRAVRRTLIGVAVGVVLTLVLVVALVAWLLSLLF
ncbi:DUF4112 domain-containing protein [Acidimicrobiia bacterium EGI L10123]|uniref:DUF4112 domain-containing protein n=1 Tax=Salinilacustrithrix flava TaxID=2957203 RepID=UPI003D7C23BA|nr:DUF4112 domain-containing protein [Acidimicrobiia bacterium EGI L10123]